MPETIALLGAGNMGTAVAQVLAANGHAVRAWSIETDVLEEMRDQRLNTKYLAGIDLHPNIEPVWEIAKAVAGAGVIVLSVPHTSWQSSRAISPPAAARTDRPQRRQGPRTRHQLTHERGHLP